ncbi:transmembrane protein [Ceratobasidium sp. AG-Ba]|nr:transmembrane protein [Ceratobasidium sp. AG-Ba]
MRALGGVLVASLSLVSAVELLPNHATPELLVVPPNVTLMTPRSGNSGFEQQMFDFGSAQSGFTELRHVLGRQSQCPNGFGTCSNQNGCCPIGGECCGGGKCCGSGRWCYGPKCCLLSENGCDDLGCCGKSQQCCKGGSCCPGGNNCVIINGKLGCCPIGQTCTGPPACQDAGYSPCPGENFCCPTGYQCYRDSSNAPMCRNPDPPTPTPTPTPSPTSTYVPPPPDPTSEASTYVPPPEITTRIIQTTQTQVVTQTVQVSSSTPRAVTSTRLSTSSQPIQTNAAIGASTKSNVGAIAGGVAAGVVAIVAIIIIVIVVLRRNKKQQETPSPQPVLPVVPPPVQYNESTSGGIPHTPGSGDPFLTPMAQHQNLGVSYFGGAPPPGSPGPTVETGSGSGPYNASQYSGLPEPQQNEMSAMTMPQPRYDSTHPRPLPMTIIHSQRPESSDGGNANRPWSGYVPPAAAAAAAAAAPYAGSNNSQPSAWTAPTNNSGLASPPPQAPAQPAYTSPPYTDGPGRPPSTVYQPSSHLAYSPPASPPPPDVYGGMAPSGSSGLPPGAAPPTNAYPSDDKKSYLPYQ